jgi:hypothetical protein
LIVMARCLWLMPLILATQEAEIRRLALGKQFVRPYLENAQHKKGLAEWLKWKRTCLVNVKP